MKKLLSELIVFFILCSMCFAETKQCWVLCQPDSYVNVRTNPKKNAEISGRLECGDTTYTDGEEKNNFLHLCNASTESGDGWINKGYVVYELPIKVMKDVNVCSFERVACRKYIGGKRRCWITGADIVKAFYISREWTITNKGFVKTEYLGVNYNVLRLADETNYGESDDLHWEDE